MEDGLHEGIEFFNRPYMGDPGPAAGFFHPDHVSGPDFPRGVAPGQEEDLLLASVSGQQHERGAGLADAGQVEEIAFLPVGIVHVVAEYLGFRPEQDHDPAAHAVEDPGPSFRKLLNRRRPGVLRDRHGLQLGSGRGSGGHAIEGHSPEHGSEDRAQRGGKDRAVPGGGRPWNGVVRALRDAARQ